MKIIVLGSGVVGTASAYYLAQAGHEVTVVDRQSAAGMETSFANAGEISPGYAAPWAGPGVPLKALKWLMMSHSPLVLRPRFDPEMWRWLLQLLRNCTAARYDINKGRMLRLAEYSRDCLRQLRQVTGISYDERMQGTLQLFRSQQQLDAASKDIAILRRYQVPYALLERAACVEAEPALVQVKHKFLGGLRLPGDETGDCFQFTQGLAALAMASGVRFDFGVAIQGLIREQDTIAAIQTSAGVMKAEAYVLAMGSYSPLLLRRIGLRIPVYPVKGYSITFPVTDATAAPVSTVMDETFKVAITRLGNRIRVGGTAEISGYDLSLTPARRLTLEHSVSDLFPLAGPVGQAQFWAGLRPMTPDGTPVLGLTPLRNLYLNTGHGTLGWTMACGSGRVLADIISGRVPDIDLAGLAMGRY
ncbi:MAG: D-amino acid dehydrogenase [Pseudomonadota bacterium]